MTPSGIQLLRWGGHRRMPWRNGAGVTYEIASAPAEAGLADFDWRISIAEVQAGGPFSSFPGIDRTLILIDGEWMALTVDGLRTQFGLRQPFAFDGDAETLCEVPGPSRDLNVMTRRGRTSASVTVIEAEAPQRRAVIDAREAVLVCLTADVQLTGADGTLTELQALDAALATDSGPLTIEGDGPVVVIELSSTA